MNNAFRYLRMMVVALFSLLGTQMMAQQDIGCEYFVGSDPGYGKATHVSATVDVAGGIMFDIPDSQLAYGCNLIGVRTFYRTETECYFSPTVLAISVKYRGNEVNRMEYFWDEDPGFGNGSPICIVPGEEVSLEQSIPVDGLSSGYHRLGLRFAGDDGWGPTTVHDVIVSNGASVTYAEYFWDEDPGFGNGSPVCIVPGEEVSVENLDIPIAPNVHGDAMLNIRFFGAGGWSPIFSHKVLVDAEGHYTLDNEMETSFEERTFQSISDILCDFSERGVGGDVIVTAVNSNVTYELDMAAEGQQERLSIMADNLHDYDHWMTFAAIDGSNNTISVTTAPNNKEELAKVLRFFSRTYLDNIILLVNGVEYNLNALKSNNEVVCSGEETVGMAISGISETLNATWTALPHENTTLRGFAVEGTGDIVSGIIVNDGTKVDSIVYVVSFVDADGDVMFTSDYKVKVYSKLAGRQFSGMSPVVGAILDPTKVTLKWDDISDAFGYELTVVSHEEHDETGATLVSNLLEVCKNSCEISLEEGHVYTWSVKAKGYCDEASSDVMTFSARRLSDLTVSTINVPEHTQAGNIMTIGITITNTGDGASVKNEWTDRLYYTIDSEDFATAKLLETFNHSGNILPGESYDIEVAITAPENDGSTLRLFVVANASNTEMEKTADNNTMMSAGILLKPFLMNVDDLVALRKFYNDFGGNQWTGSPWNIESEVIRSDNWSGVTFNAEGRVSAIDLTARGLAGLLSTDNAPVLPELASMNLSRNAISGDASLMVAGMPLLSTLNLSYNKITEVSSVLPSSIKALDLGNQYRMYNSTILPDIYSKESLRLVLGSTIAMTPATLDTYSHASQDWSSRCNYDVFSLDMKTKYGCVKYDSGEGGYIFYIHDENTEMSQDEDVVLIVSSGISNGTAYPATVRYTMGDANIDARVDVLDAQHTLNYIMGTQKGDFNFSAADTYQSGSITVQDVVATVNIFIESDDNAVQPSMAKSKHAKTVSEGYSALCVKDGAVWLDSDADIAALDISLSGIKANDVQFVLSSHNYQLIKRNTADGVRLVILSPAGDIMKGCCRLFRLAHEAQILSVMAANSDAEYVDVHIVDATGISEIEIDGDGDVIYDMAGRKVNKAYDGVRIWKGKKILKKNR